MATDLPSQKAIMRFVEIDASGATLGHLASEAARLLVGKTRAFSAPSAVVGDFVIVVNADKVIVPDSKQERKELHRYNGHAGGPKSISVEERMRISSDQVVKEAIIGILPKNGLGHTMARRLRVYRGAYHPHRSQAPIRLERYGRSFKPLVTFKKQLLARLEGWLKVATPDERNAVVVTLDGRELTILDLRRELERGTKIGAQYLETMYRFLLFERSRSKHL